MEYVTTLSGVRMPCIIYGTAWKKGGTSELVAKAIKLGFRGIDTACQPKHYHEAGVGEALNQLDKEGLSRKDFFIQTKFTPSAGQDPDHIPYDLHASLAEQVAQSFEASKKNLKVSYVDSLVLHSPLDTMDSLLMVWQAMESICRQGEAKQLGISNCYHLDTLKALYEKASIKPAVVQNRFYKQTHYDAELRKWCQERQIIYQSFWTLTANPDLLLHPVVQMAARTLQKTEAQILFRFLTQIGIVPLTGTCSETHMKQDLDIFQFKLPNEIIQDLGFLIHSG